MQIHPASTSSDAILLDIDAAITRVADRIAREDAAFRAAPRHLRVIDAGHRCLVVTRCGEPCAVALVDLTEGEIAEFVVEAV